MVTKIPLDKPIAFKKLNNGNGLWATQKEILGWVFDGITRCISLPTHKVKSLLHELHTMARQNMATLRDLQCLQGNLIHTAHGMPNGKGLLSPLMALIARHTNNRKNQSPLTPTPNRSSRIGMPSYALQQPDQHHAQISLQHQQTTWATAMHPSMGPGASGLGVNAIYPPLSGDYLSHQKSPMHWYPPQTQTAPSPTPIWKWPASYVTG